MIPPDGTGPRAIAWALEQVEAGSTGWTNQCLRFVRTSVGAPAMGGSARTAWAAAQHKHTEPGHPPAGVPVFMAGGKYGHVVLSLGGGRCVTTDYVTRDRAGVALIADVVRGWGMTYLGWSEDVNGVRVTGWSYPGEPKHGRRPAHVPYSRKIRRGMKGPDVSDLRAHLGFRRPRRRFGPVTNRRVIAIQRAEYPALGKPDGIVGPLTYKRITGHK